MNIARKAMREVDKIAELSEGGKATKWGSQVRPTRSAGRVFGELLIRAKNLLQLSSMKWRIEGGLLVSRTNFLLPNPSLECFRMHFEFFLLRRDQSSLVSLGFPV